MWPPINWTKITIDGQNWDFHLSLRRLEEIFNAHPPDLLPTWLDKKLFQFAEMKEKFKIKYVWSFVDYSNTLLDYTIILDYTGLTFDYSTNSPVSMFRFDSTLLIIQLYLGRN